MESTSRGFAVLLATAVIAIASPAWASAVGLGDEFPLALSGASDARIAASGSMFLVVWTDRSGSSTNVRGRLVRASDGQATGGSFVIAGSAADESNPAVASDGSGFFVVWRQGSPPDLRGARVSESGAVLDPGGFEIVPPVGGGEPSYSFTWDTDPADAAVDWNGSAWNVVTTQSAEGDGRGVFSNLVAPDGTVTSHGFGGIANYDVALAAVDGEQVSVTYSSDSDSFFDAVLPPGGKIAGGELTPYDSGDRFTGAVATDGKDALFVYACTSVCGSPTADDPTRIWTVEIDGVTGAPREETRHAISGVVDTTLAQSAIAWSGRYWIARTEAGPEIDLDDVQLFSNATSPGLAIAGRAGLAIADRGDSIVARVIQLDTTSPTPTPTPTASATPTPSATATASPTPTASLGPTPTPSGASPTPTPSGARSHGGGCEITVTAATPAFALALFAFGAFAAFRRRRRVHD